MSGIEFGTPDYAKKRRIIAPPRGQTSTWDGERATLQEAIAYTRESLTEYISRFRHIVLNFSGGKDSSALLTLYAWFRRTGQIPVPESELVLMSDTRMELFPLMISARRMLEQCGLPYRIVQPELRLAAPGYTERFFVYMLGIGVPPPNSVTLRWCTRKLKADPMHRVKLELFEHYGDELLSLTGVRRGESANRDKTIAIACSKDDGECGQGVFQSDHTTGPALAPIDRWRLCHVEDWLTFDAPSYGFDTRELCSIYGFDQDEKTAKNTGLRTGCMKCPLVGEDRSFAYVMSKPEWAYLEPINQLEQLYEELRLPRYRLRKNGERNKNGKLSANHNRMGPLTMGARRFGVKAVLSIQDAVNEAARTQGRPEIELISAEELAYIRELRALDVWPQGWTGNERRADELRSYVVDDELDQEILL